MYYEYKALPLHGNELENTCKGLTAVLNEMNKSGWEFVSILSHNGLGSSSLNIFGITQKQLLIFKRPLSQEAAK